MIGAIDWLKVMKNNVEHHLGMELTQAASGYPPGVPQSSLFVTPIGIAMHDNHQME